MTQIFNSAKLSLSALQSEVDKLRIRERRWCKTGTKRALYRYLQGVFDLYAATNHSQSDQRVAIEIAMLAGLNRPYGRHCIRVIIDATTSADRKSRSRWTQALRYAWRHRSTWSDLGDCLRANGGISGCADKWADVRAERRPPAGFVRIGGEGRFPKIPLFVSAELAKEYE